MKASRATGIFVTIVLMLIGTSYVSSEPGVAVDSVEASHVAYYRHHLASLGIERLNCR